VQRFRITGQSAAQQTRNSKHEIRNKYAVRSTKLQAPNSKQGPKCARPNPGRLLSPVGRPAISHGRKPVDCAFIDSEPLRGDCPRQSPHRGSLPDIRRSTGLRRVANRKRPYGTKKRSCQDLRIARGKTQTRTKYQKAKLRTAGAGIRSKRHADRAFMDETLKRDCPSACLCF